MRDGADEVFGLRFARAVVAEKVVRADGKVGVSRRLVVIGKPRIDKGIALCGFDKGKGEVMSGERFLIDLALIAGDVHALDGV